MRFCYVGMNTGKPSGLPGKQVVTGDILQFKSSAAKSKLLYCLLKGGVSVSAQTLQSMVTWVHCNALENPTLEDISKHLGYSPFYCSTQFKGYVGTTIRRYIAQVKLEAAADLLRNTNGRVVDIALHCGYSSHEALTRAFAAKYACSPMEYRQRHQERKVML